MSRARAAPAASAETKMNVWLNVAAIVVPILLTVGGGLFVSGELSGTIKSQLADQSKDIDLKLAPLAGKVNDVSNKVDTATQLLQTKQDNLTKDFAQNQSEQQTFRTDTRNLFSKLFDAQQALSQQINQERVDRLTENAKKK